MENSGMSIARGAGAEQYQAASLHFGAEPAVSWRLETGAAAEPLPIWMAVLVATSCRARSGDENHAVRWMPISGRATYTNLGSEDEHIEPLGVRLPGGKTLAVSWVPGETAYTLEVYSKQ